MNKILSFYNNRKIRSKMLINYICIIFVTIVGLSTIVTSISGNSVENLADKNTYQIIKQVNNNIEFYINNIEDIVFYISNNDEVERFLLFEKASDDNIGNIFQQYELRHNEIAGMMIVNNRDECINTSMERISRDRLCNEAWYIGATHNKKELCILSNTIGRNIRYKDNIHNGDNVVSISKAILDEKGNVLGVVLIDLNTKIFDDIIENVALANGGFVYIIDDENNVVYSPINEIVYRIQPKWINDSEIAQVVKIKNTSYKIIKHKSEYTGWRVIGVFSLNDTLRPVREMQMLIVIFSLILVIFLFFFAFFMANTITKPLDKLKGLMKKAEEGKLDVSFEGIYEDEITELGNSFNKMIEAMKNLINLVHVEHNQKRQAELEILKAQIKPHFLYNTLDTIHWLIKENKNKEAIVVLKALTKLFRISLSKGKDQITIKEELKHVESYLIIQMVRYSDKFTYSINCDEGIYKYKVTKLILQPLIENAIYHGIKEKRGKCKIDITVEINDNILVFIVADDGVGIAKEKLEFLNSVLEKNVEKKNEYGIVNVNEKIKITYGEVYGVTLESKLGEGTKSIIRHPII
ncbi:sensor histidine kinase [Clostridium sp. DL1XJH146]